MSDRTWSRVWRAWVLLGIALELISLRYGKPLTRVFRGRVLNSSGGSALVGGFLVWLLYHWGLDAGGGLGLLDAIAVVVGGLLGVVGYRVRAR